MPLFSRAISLWLNFFHRQQREQELDEELRSLRELLTEQKMREGMDPEEARRAARIELGGVEQVKEQVRAVRTGAWLDTLLQDIRFALRMLRKNPSFSVVAAVTLALGIGANTAMFSVVDAILLQPLPYQDATRLVVVNETTPKVGTVSVSYPDFLDWRADSHDFSRMAAIQDVAFTLAGVSQPENISGEAVTPNFLSMLGIRPFLGRDFNASDENGGAAPILLLSYELWQSHFGGDPNAVGKTVTLDGRSFTIIGVLPQHFRSLEKTDVIVPIGVWLTNNPVASGRGDRGDMVVVGRLSPDVTFTATRAEMEGIAARLAKDYPTTNDQFGVSLRPIRDVFVGDTRSAVLVLFGAVLFVLLIACANVANLFLVRGAARTNEITMRMALGASRGRMLRQMLTESFVLAFLGGALGLVLAIGGIQGIVQVIPAATLSGATVKLNATVLLFVGGVVVLAAFIFGLAPALYATKPDVRSELKEAGRPAGATVMQNKLRSALAISEMSLALVLLVGAGLMIKSLSRLMEVDPGFRTDRLLTMEIDLRAQQYSKDPAVLNFWQQVLDRVGALPGVESAAVGTVVPLTHNHSRGDITVEGMALPKPGNYPHPDIHIVSPGYVVTIGIPLLRGRTFTDADNEKAPPVGMINAMAARRFF